MPFLSYAREELKLLCTNKENCGRIPGSAIPPKSWWGDAATPAKILLHTIANFHLLEVSSGWKDISPLAPATTTGLLGPTIIYQQAISLVKVCCSMQYSPSGPDPSIPCPNSTPFCLHPTVSTHILPHSTSVLGLSDLMGLLLSADTRKNPAFSPTSQLLLLLQQSVSSVAACASGFHQCFLYIGLRSKQNKNKPGFQTLWFWSAIVVYSSLRLQS